MSQIPFWAVALAIVLGAVVAAIVARPRYTGRHRAPGLPNYRPQQAMWKEWVRGYPEQYPTRAEAQQILGERLDALRAERERS